MSTWSTITVSTSWPHNFSGWWQEVRVFQTENSAVIDIEWGLWLRRLRWVSTSRCWNPSTCRFCEVVCWKQQRCSLHEIRSSLLPLAGCPHFRYWLVIICNFDLISVETGGSRHKLFRESIGSWQWCCGIRIAASSVQGKIKYTRFEPRTVF